MIFILALVLLTYHLAFLVTAAGCDVSDSQPFVTDRVPVIYVNHWRTPHINYTNIERGMYSSLLKLNDYILKLCT